MLQSDAEREEEGDVAGIDSGMGKAENLNSNEDMSVLTS